MMFGDKPSYHTNNAACSINAEPCTKLLSEFGLSEKEAQLYVHLLKYGPKRAGDLARSLKTYRLQVYRKLASLADKTMVTAKRESPSVYTAMNLDDALDAVLLPLQRELRRMEEIKRELIVLANGTQFLASDEIPSEALALDNEQALVKLLSEFGLSEKEAQLYVHLLKYGPKRAGDLARSLKTYREDAYRRCARLIDAGMIVKSAGDSSRYAPVDLDEALDAALMSRQCELRRLQTVKHELVTDTNGALSRGADTAHAFKMLKTVGELVAAISQLINSAETSVVFVAHPQFNLITMGGFLDHLKCAAGRDVHVRGVLDISLQNLSAGREYLKGGIELRHTNPYRGMTLVVADGKRSISLIHAALKAALSLDENVAALWSDSVAQAEFLVSAFEMAWEQASGAEERIDALLQQEHRSLESVATSN
ncbi:MAG: helix-turn-helix domain-containing protein [Halobacteriota archaeon]|jgi:sugar-specific transcriptional regulator TrmB